MDLGLRGRRALVCGGSRGLGRACARALAIEGVAVTIAARRPGPLSETADVIGRESGATTTTVAADVTTDAGQAAMLAVCPDPDIIVTNAGGPPHGEFEDWTWDDWLTVANDQMLSPIMLIRATIDAMIARKFGRIVVITSRTVRMPVARLGLSSGARSGLTGFLAGLARDVARHNVTINFILPGPFQTDRFENNLDNAAARTGGGPGSDPRPARRGDAGRAARQPGRGGRRLRLFVRYPVWLYHRPELADRRRRLPGHPVMGTLPFDIAVIGGGVMGCGTALHVARGGMRTVLLEKGRLCREASGANAGGMTLQDKPAEMIPYFLEARSLWRSAPDWLGRVNGHVETGGLMLAFREDEEALLENGLKDRQAAGLPVELVGANRARELEPALSHHVVGATYCPWDGYGDSAATGALYGPALRDAGVSVREDTPVSDIRLIPLHPVTQYEGATQLSVGERVVGRESALCLGLSRVAPLRA